MRSFDGHSQALFGMALASTLAGNLHADLYRQARFERWGHEETLGRKARNFSTGVFGCAVVERLGAKHGRWVRSDGAAKRAHGSGSRSAAGGFGTRGAGRCRFRQRATPRRAAE